MAKIQEEIVVIKVSRLLRDQDQADNKILGTESLESLEVVIQELAGQGTLIEIATE